LFVQTEGTASVTPVIHALLCHVGGGMTVLVCVMLIYILRIQMPGKLIDCFAAFFFGAKTAALVVFLLDFPLLQTLISFGC